MSKDDEFAQQNQDLQIVKLKKKEVLRGLSNVKLSIGSYGDEVQEMLEQRKKLERKLELKQREFFLLKELDEENHEEILDMLSLKEEEITELKEKLEQLKNKLKNAEVQIFECEKQLHKLTTELKMKSNEVILLQEANAQTKQELDLEREKVDHFCMQQTAAAESEDRYKRETNVSVTILTLMFYNNCVITGTHKISGGRSTKKIE